MIDVPESAEPKPRSLQFDPDELADRRGRAVEAMQADGLDAVLLFRQESMYYLSGYDTIGYVFFQCLYLGSDGRMTLLTRAPDLLQAHFTSVIEDVRVWVDAPDAAPWDDVRSILEEHGRRGGRVGVEFDAYGLTARNGRRLTDALEGFCTLVDASDLVSRLRLVKSPAELEYVRRAGKLVDAELQAAIENTHAGAFEGDIMAAMLEADYRGGGDRPALENIVGSGPGALMCRYYTGRRHLDPDDQLTLELGGVYRHYHACLMRTLLIGQSDPRLHRMHEAARDALLAAEGALRPGASLGSVFDAQADVLDRAGQREHRLNACGYSLGATYAPNWMDWPMLYRGNPVEAGPGMVFFIHIILFDAANSLAMTLGRTSVVADSGSEPLSELSLDLIQR